MFVVLIFFVSKLLGISNVFHQSTEPILRDWFDHERDYFDTMRKGLGENGSHVYLNDLAEINLNNKLYDKIGFSVIVSDKISVNRSIPKIVHPDCEKIKYFAQLPKTSIIVIFHNEVKSVLLRTVHSIINRTPAELLHEIILVNDNSTNEDLYEPLQNYISTNFCDKVRIKNLKERHGLIRTRMEGARDASGEVLVVS